MKPNLTAFAPTKEGVTATITGLSADARSMLEACADGQCRCACDPGSLGVESVEITSKDDQTLLTIKGKKVDPKKLKEAMQSCLLD